MKQNEEKVVKFFFSLKFHSWLLLRTPLVLNKKKYEWDGSVFGLCHFWYNFLVRGKMTVFVQRSFGTHIIQQEIQNKANGDIVNTNRPTLAGKEVLIPLPLIQMFISHWVNGQPTTTSYAIRCYAMLAFVLSCFRESNELQSVKRQTLLIRVCLRYPIGRARIAVFGDFALPFRAIQEFSVK
jgi:hypothetical protein